MITIINKENCTGCYACKNICPKECITMESDTEGFWYPKVNIEICNDCGLCEIVCPIIHKSEMKNNPLAYASYNKNEKIRMNSSSGGLFTIIAEQTINEGGVVFGAKFDDEFYVVHDYTETKEGLKEFRGSKYVQSKVGDTYKDVKRFLKQGRKVLFTGTPCQVGGLKSYLQRNYDDLFCVDIICHGVPSPKVWQKYILYQENYYASTLRKIAFRRKEEGWKQYSVSLLFNNNTEYLQSHRKDLYMKAFLKNVCLRPSCYACKYKTIHRESDITLADFWGVQSILPELDDDKGTSLLFINSEKGKRMFNKIKDQVIHYEVDINKAIIHNSAAIKSVNRNPKRDRFFEELDNISFNKLVSKYCSDSVLGKFKRKGKAILKKVKGLYSWIKILQTQRKSI